MIKKLPKSFFEKERPRVVNESKQDITPIKWSSNVISGKQKVTFGKPATDWLNVEDIKKDSGI